MSIKLSSQNSTNDIIITNVCFPCLSKFSDYVVSTSNIFAHFENTCMLTSHANAIYIFGGDFNFECVDNNSSYKYNINSKGYSV